MIRIVIALAAVAAALLVVPAASAFPVAQFNAGCYSAQLVAPQVAYTAPIVAAPAPVVYSQPQVAYAPPAQIVQPMAYVQPQVAAYAAPVVAPVRAVKAYAAPIVAPVRAGKVRPVILPRLQSIRAARQLNVGASAAVVVPY